MLPPRLNSGRRLTHLPRLFIRSIKTSRIQRFPYDRFKRPTIPRDYHPIILSRSGRNPCVDHTHADTLEPSIHLLTRIVWRVDRERERGKLVERHGSLSLSLGRRDDDGTVGSGRECRRRVRTRVKGVNARASRSHSLSKLEPEREQDWEDSGKPLRFV